MTKTSGGQTKHDPRPMAPPRLALPAGVVIYDGVEYQVIWNGVGPLPGYHGTRPTGWRV